MRKRLAMLVLAAGMMMSFGTAGVMAEETTEAVTESGADIVFSYEDIDASVYEGTWVSTGLGFDIYLPSDWDVLEVSEENAAKDIVYQAADSAKGWNVAISYSKGMNVTADDIYAQLKAGGYEYLYTLDLNGIPAVGFDLDEMKVAIDWLRVPEAYELYSPADGIDITLHAGRRADGTWVCADEIDDKYPGTKKEVNRLLETCRKVYESVLFLNEHTLSKAEMLLKHEALVKTAGYSAKEVLEKSFHLPEEVVKILSAYWIYVGQPISTLPFTIYSFLMADYMIGGSYVARGFSHEMSVAMAERCEELGVQFEYCQNVEKILVRNGRVYGVRTSRGDEIHCDYIASAPYPNTVYGRMIEPQSEVPVQARKYANAMPMSVTCFSVVLLLDQKPEDLNIHSYSVFSSDIPFDTDVFWAQGRNLGGWDYLTTICLNYANDEAVPEGAFRRRQPGRFR